MIDPSKVKAESEAAIRAAGGQPLDTLPYIDLEELSLRTSLEVAQRALVLNVLVNLSFGAPPSIAHGWLAKHSLLEELSDRERNFLFGNSLEDRQRNELRWGIESLWSAVWAGGMIRDLSPTQPVQDSLASLMPSLRSSEPPDAFLERFRLRSLEELYPTLDLFYRAHWFARNAHLRGEDSGGFNLGVVQCRRRLLEWATHSGAGWEAVDLST